MSKERTSLEAHRILLIGAMSEAGKLEEVRALQSHIEAILDAAEDDDIGLAAITIAYFGVILSTPGALD